jgi:hypothetical protein
MIGLYILDEDNNPVPEPDLATWGRWHALDERRIVGRHELPPGPHQSRFVSTVFLGSDHGWGRPGSLPILWETMVFGFPKGHEYADYQERYTSLEDAQAGHRSVVAALTEHDPT